LETSLGYLDEERKSEIIEEVRRHLEDRVRYLQLGGLSKEDSMSKAIEHFGSAKEIGGEMRQVYGRGTWGEALLAALPSLLLAVVALSLPHLVNFDERVILSLLIALALAFPAVAIYTWWRGIPIWSYPWLGVGSFSCASTLGVLLWRVLGPLPFNAPILPIIGLLFLYGPILLVIALLLPRRGWPAASCAVLSWVGVMVLSFQEEVLMPLRPTFIVAVCLLWAAATALFVIGPRKLKAMGLAGGIGALIAADAIARWRYALPGNRPAPSHELILLALFLLGPALAMGKRRMGRLWR